MMMNMEYKYLKKVHEYFTIPSLCMIIKPNSYVPGRNSRLDSLE